MIYEPSSLALIFTLLLGVIGWTALITTILLGRTPRARHVRANTSERAAKTQVKIAEREAIQGVTKRLKEEAAADGRRFSKKELEDEARRILASGYGR
jgi:hypothetical protein